MSRFARDRAAVWLESAWRLADADAAADAAAAADADASAAGFPPAP